jgi:CRISPR-associated protein Cas10/Cmr2 subtype III-B
LSAVGEPRRWALLLGILLHDVPWKPWAVTRRLEGRGLLVLEALQSDPQRIPGDAERVREILYYIEKSVGGRIERNDEEALALIAWIAERLEAHRAPEASRVLVETVRAEWRGLIHRADILASSVDRQLHPAGLNATKFTNIFYPAWTRNLYPVRAEELVGFVGEFLADLDRLVRAVVESCRGRDGGCVLWKLYLTLYALVEKLWHDASHSRTMPAADTRIPHHTVFEHLRASTAALALRERALIALVDIPGVHAFISTGRKTRDFWAGSWLISLLAWASVKGLVERVGPQSILSPALHLNPFYLDLIVSLAPGAEALLINSRTGERDYIAWRGGWPSQPLMPATILLLLDPSDPALHTLASDLGCESEDLCSMIKCITENSLRAAWNSIWRLLREEIEAIRSSHEEAERLCSDPLAWDSLRRVEAEEKVVRGALRLVCLHAYTASPQGGLYDYLRSLLDYLDAATREPPVGLRVTCALADYTSKEYQDFIEGVIKNLSSIEVAIGGSRNGRELVERLLPENVSLESMLSNSLRIAYALASLEEEARKAPNVSAPHAIGVAGAVRALWDAVERLGAGARAYRYCSHCGRLPAVARMPRLGEETPLAGGVEFDDEIFNKLLEATGYLADEGESFCPYCLLKRMLGKAPQLARPILATASRAPEHRIHSVLLTANEWIPKVEDLVETFGDKISIERIVEGLAREGESLYRYIGVMYGDGDSVGSGYLKGVLFPPSSLTRDSEYGRLGEIALENLDTKVLEGLRRLCGRPAVGSARELLEGLVRGAEWWEVLPPLIYYSILYSSASGSPPPCDAVLANAVLVAAASRLLRARGWLGEEEVPSILVTPSYLQALSTALMTTALVDSVIVEALRGTLVYAGGDDVLAILPPAHDPNRNPIRELAASLNTYTLQAGAYQSVPNSLETLAGIGADGPISVPWLAVAATRLNYWGLLGGEPGFHVYRGLAAQAAAAHGRSYGVAIVHYKTPLWLALEEARELMEMKDEIHITQPAGRIPPKDVVVVGYGIGGEPGALPESLYTPSDCIPGPRRAGLSAGFKLVSMLYAEIQGGGVFTSSLVYDMLEPHNSELVRRLYSRGSLAGVGRIVDYVLRSNARSTRDASSWISNHANAIQESNATGVSLGQGSLEPLTLHSFRILRYLLAGSRR